MEVSALTYSGGIGLHARSPLLRLQSDERLVTLVRRGNAGAFEVLVSRYGARLLSFCRHLLASREDAEDVLQEVMAAAYNAIRADERPINVRPWLYRIARNRCLNHLRRSSAVGVDSMDVHLSDHGASTADKVHEREDFRLLVGDIRELPETQRTALVLREMDALSYDQIAEAMETTVSSVKSLLVRARVSLAEAAEARLLTCEEVRIELGEVAEGLRRRPTPLVRRHLRACQRCDSFRVQLKATNRALAALLPIGPLVLLKKLAITHVGHSAGSGATAASSGAGSSAAAGSGAAVAGSAAAGSSVLVGSAGSFVSAGLGAVATKAAAGLAAAALVTAGAVEVDRSASRPAHPAPAHAALTHTPAAGAAAPASGGAAPATAASAHPGRTGTRATPVKAAAARRPAHKPDPGTTTSTTTTAPATTTTAAVPVKATSVPDGRTQTQTDATVLKPPAGSTTSADSTIAPPTTTTSGDSTTTTSSTTTSPAGSTTTTPTDTSPDTTTTSPSDPSVGDGSSGGTAPSS